MGTKTSTSQLIEAVSAATGHAKSDVKSVLDAVVSEVSAQIADGNSVAVTDLGTFKPTHRKTREGRNPSTGETIQIAASNGAGFTASKALKDALN